MNATEARNLACNAELTLNKEQYDEIKKKIESTAKNGEFFIWYIDEIVDLSVKKELHKEGFLVQDYRNRNEVNTKISW